MELLYERSKRFENYDASDAIAVVETLNNTHYKNWFYFLGNATPPINSTLGYDHLTEKLQKKIPQEVREAIVAKTPEGVSWDRLFWEAVSDMWESKKEKWNDTDEYFHKDEWRAVVEAYNKKADALYELPWNLKAVKKEAFENVTEPFRQSRIAFIEARDALLQAKLDQDTEKYEPLKNATDALHEELKNQTLENHQRLAQKLALEEVNLGLMAARNYNNKHNFYSSIGRPASIACIMNPACCENPLLCAPDFLASKFGGAA